MAQRANPRSSVRSAASCQSAQWVLCLVVPQLATSASCQTPNNLGVDRFVGIPEAAAIREIFPDASVVDMESSALAQTAVLHGTPFISVRSVTDVIGESETSVHLDEVDNSSEQAATAALGILGRV